MSARALVAMLLAVGAAACSDEGGAATSSDEGRPAEAAATCDAYPEGPYGPNEGDYLDAEVVLSGIVEGGVERTDVRLGDLRDCDGRTGVGALYFIAARTTCSVCNREAPEIAADLEALRERGIRVVYMMMDGGVEPWRDFHDLHGALILDDPDWTLNVEDDRENGTPLNVVVDPRTGRIVERDLGGAFDRDALYELAERNLE